MITKMAGASSLIEALAEVLLPVPSAWNCSMIQQSGGISAAILVWTRICRLLIF
jgi:hypothetical protein